MNRNQLQLEVCKALLDPLKRRCGGAFINEDEFAVTTDGFTAFVFHKSECVFDISKVRINEGVKKAFERHEADIEIKKTKHLFYGDNKVIEKYTGENLVVYVDAKVAKTFEGYGCRFFASSSTSRILVKDSFDRLLGLFLPVKFDESEVTKNA